MRAIIARERIKTIVTLTAINRDEPKYVRQAKVVDETGVNWLIVPMRGSRATIEQMAQAADLLADTQRQPIFFHCVAGHHRTSLAHAAYLIRCRGWTAAAAWKEVANLPWARPAARADQNDKALIDEFAGFQRSLEVASPSVTSEVHDDDEVSLAPDYPFGREASRRDHDRLANMRRLEPSESQFRRSAIGTRLSLGSDARLGPIETLRERRIKTVLNLRGSNPTESWYRDEIATTREACATHVDVAMSSCLWMSRVQLRALVQTLDTAEYPLLIHCAWGSERTGLVSAFAELLRPGGTLDDARAQFSIRYLFVRVNDGKVMAEHLDQYANWLRERGIEHQPANFHRWVDAGFLPGQPSREDWEYDPYPLVVVARPGDTPAQQRPMAKRAGSTSRRR